MRKRFHKTNNTGQFTSILVALILFFLSIVVFLYGVGIISKNNALDEKKNLQETIQKDIIHCYALEGIYPPTLDYIEENYGLMYNKNKFIVDYRSDGSNIMPKVIIIER